MVQKVLAEMEIARVPPAQDKSDSTAHTKRELIGVAELPKYRWLQQIC